MAQRQDVGGCALPSDHKREQLGLTTQHSIKRTGGALALWQSPPLVAVVYQLGGALVAVTSGRPHAA